MWFRVYCALMAVLLLGVVALVALSGGAAPSTTTTTTMTTSSALVLAVVVPLAALYVAGVFVPFRPWGWTLGLVAIAFGVSSALIVVAAPLLVFWTRPATKAAFGRL